MNCLVLLLPVPCVHREQQGRAVRDAAPVGGAEDQREPHQPYYWVYVWGQQQLGGRVVTRNSRGCVCVGGTKQCGHWCGSVGALSPGDIWLSVCVHRRVGVRVGWCTEEIVYSRVYTRRCQGGGVAGVLIFVWRRID